MNVSSHGGHNEIIQGANANGRKEHVMDRQCNAEFINRLRQLGHSVEDDTDNVGRSASTIVGNQVRNINDRYNDVGFSWHLNASNGEGHGVEVLCYSEKEAPVARKISAELAKRTGWKDRGAKIRPDIGVIRSSNCPFYLVECGFIDNEDDMSKWDVDAIVSAVIFAFFGAETSGSPVQPHEPHTTPSNTSYETGVVRCLTNVNLRREPHLGDNKLRVLPEGSEWEYFYKVYDGSYWWYNHGGNQFTREDNMKKIR